MFARQVRFEATSAQAIQEFRYSCPGPCNLPHWAVGL